jgi:chorismate mutase/prephenate dehydratase
MSEVLRSTAYLGIPGSFSHSAAVAYFGDSSVYEGGAAFKDVFSMVANGQSHYGIVPIENTSAGSIYDNYDLLEEHELYVAGEINIRVRQTLLVSKHAIEATTSDIQEVYSHPKALEQCSRFFEQHPHIKLSTYADTATAAKFVSEQDDPTIAAISNSDCADIYDLRALQSNVQDSENNYTRFLAISPEQPQVDGANKCSLIIHLAHEPGSLNHVIGFFAEAGCNLTKIESRPLRDKPFEYSFYMDYVFDPNKQPMAELLDDLQGRVDYLRNLGFYTTKLNNIH